MASGQKIEKQAVGEPLIVAVETSGRMGSVAIADGAQVIAEKHFTAVMRHSAELFGAISVLLERARKAASDIDEVYVSAGPGSFTGLRIAASFAKTMRIAKEVRIVGVGTLDVIAANARDFERDTGTNVGSIGVILDAKRGQFYAAIYKKNDTKAGLTGKNSAKDIQRIAEDGGNLQIALAKVLPDAVLTAEQFLETARPQGEPIWLLGEGLVYFKDKFTAEGVRFMPEEYWNPRASKVHELGWEKAQRGEYEDAATFAPKYLGRPDIRVKLQ